MTEAIERMLPLYQGMMATFYNHRAADVVKSATATKRQNQPQYLTEAELKDPSRLAMPAYWVAEDLIPSELPDWLIAFSNVSSPTNERSMISYPLPKVGVGHSIPLVLVHARGLALLGMFCSYIFDYSLRQKLGGVNLTYNYLQQLPALRPEILRAIAPWDQSLSLQDWIVQRVGELSFTANDLVAIGREVGLGETPRPFDPARREVRRAELDAAFFHLYGIERDDVDYIMETFPIVKRKDIAAHGEFRTKRLILEIYDAMRVAIDTGIQYRSEFDEELTHG